MKNTHRVKKRNGADNRNLKNIYKLWYIVGISLQQIN